MGDGALERMAELLVGFGANIQPGQPVVVGSDAGKEALAWAVVERCYRSGAVFVDVQASDHHVTRARVLHGSDEALRYEPDWMLARPRELETARGAMIVLSGPGDTTPLAGLDPERLRASHPPSAIEWMRLAMERRVNWTVGPAPTPEWARLVHPTLEPEDALRRLWEQVGHACRLDCDDPVAAWTRRAAELADVCARLTAARFDRLHVIGPGTDLTVGLFESSRWLGLEERTGYGLVYRPNLPSEEVFTTPDPARVDGALRCTRPVIVDGVAIHDLALRFDAGVVVHIDAATGVDSIRALTGTDAGAARLGEFALVDATSRIAALDTVFYDPLFDENAACHIALGNAFPDGVDDEADRGRINTSETHIDLMFGAPDVQVFGVGRDDERTAVLTGGEWRL